MTRRNFLSLAAAGSLILYARPTWALTESMPTSSGAKTPKYLVWLTMPGGWDTTLSLDPWTAATRPSFEDLFLEYQTSELVKSANIFLGPAAKVIAKYAPQSVVLNGLLVSLSDNGHDAAETFMLSGDSSGALPWLGVNYENLFPDDLQGFLTSRSPYLGNSTSSKTTNFASIHASVFTDLVEQSESLLDGDIGSSAAVLMRKNKPEILAFAADLKTLSGDSTHPEKIAASAFLHGISHAAAIEITNDQNLDTHQNHEKAHLMAQTARWARIDEILAFFKSVQAGRSGDSLFDQTLFVVTSEFTRTPGLNGANGKDHEPRCNSALLIGASLNGGQTIGSSIVVTARQSDIGRSYLRGLPLAFGPRKKMVSPTDLSRTILDLMNVNPNSFGSIATEGLVIPGVKKS